MKPHDGRWMKSVQAPPNIDDNGRGGSISKDTVSICIPQTSSLDLMIINERYHLFERHGEVY